MTMKEIIFYIIIPLLSALLGGGLTLLGVLITVNRNNKDRKEDEIKKNKPLLFIVERETAKIPENHERKLLRIRKDCLGDCGTKYEFSHIVVYNGDYSYSAISGIMINDIFYEFETGQVLNKDSYTALSIDGSIANKEDVNSVYLILVDMLENAYKLKVNYDIEPPKNKKENSLIIIKSGIELTRI